MKIIKFFLLPAIVLSLFVSCDLINPEEQIPAYISIDKFQLYTNITTEGPSNHSITDAWVSVNGTFIGVFELPALFPVLIDGDANIYIKPGIKNNGIAASRETYPFYAAYEINSVLVPSETLSLNPTTKYHDESVFDWFENFENPGISIDTTFRSLVPIIDTIVGGSNVAMVKLSEAYPVFDSETLNKFNFPQENTTVYIEMDYIANNSFVVGLMISTLGQIAPTPVISINPIDEWNKIYIDLTYFSATNNYADNYSVYISAAKTDSVDNPVIMFDNLKLIRF